MCKQEAGVGEGRKSGMLSADVARKGSQTTPRGSQEETVKSGDSAQIGRLRQEDR